MTYVLIKDENKIVYLGDLPDNFGKDKDLKDKIPEERRALGWYPAVIVDSPFDPDTQKKGAWIVEVGEVEVTITIPTIDLTEEELAEKARELEKAWAEIRAKRDRLLTECDWTQLPDAPLSEEKVLEYRAYRQALRDIPQEHQKPEDVVWPTKPE